MFDKQNKIICVTALLSAVTLVLCIVMSLHSLNGAALVGCGAGSGCDTVLGGKWSMLFGFFPVSGLAAGVYAAALFCLLFLFFTKDEEIKTLAKMALVVLSGAILGSAVWFISLQIFAEGALCKYCMTAHTLGIIISILILRTFLPDVKKGWLLFAGGVFTAVVLALVQILVKPEYVYQNGTSEKDLPFISAEGRPVVGDPEAEYLVDLLFDYQCNHCQHLHHLLEDVVEEFDGRVAFVLCPCPLSPKCNPYIPPEETQFEGSCDFAKLAMALYSIDKDAYATFDDWLFENPKAGKWSPRLVADAYAKAAELVPAGMLEEAVGGDEVKTLLNKVVELFGRTSIYGHGGVPRFVYGNSWVIPNADSVDEIVTILTSEFGFQ